MSCNCGASNPLPLMSGGKRRTLSRRRVMRSSIAGGGLFGFGSSQPQPSTSYTAPVSSPPVLESEKSDEKPWWKVWGGKSRRHHKNKSRKSKKTRKHRRHRRRNN